MMPRFARPTRDADAIPHPSRLRTAATSERDAFWYSCNRHWIPNADVQDLSRLRRRAARTLQRFEDRVLLDRPPLSRRARQARRAGSPWVQLGEEEPRGSTSAPDDSTTTRSTAFASSRTLPGQSYARRSAIVSG